MNCQNADLWLIYPYSLSLLIERMNKMSHVNADKCSGKRAVKF
jgi:hypothetical protein